MVTHTHRGGGELQILLRPPPQVANGEAEAPSNRAPHQPQKKLPATAAEGDHTGDDSPVGEGKGGGAHQRRDYTFPHNRPPSNLAAS